MHGDMNFANVASATFEFCGRGGATIFATFEAPQCAIMWFTTQVKLRQEQQLKVNHQIISSGKKTKDKRCIERQILFQVRYFTPPQADQPEIFIMAEQEGYGGNYGGDGTKPGKSYTC